MGIALEVGRDDPLDQLGAEATAGWRGDWRPAGLNPLEGEGSVVDPPYHRDAPRLVRQGTVLGGVRRQLMGRERSPTGVIIQRSTLYYADNAQIILLWPSSFSACHY